MVTHLIASGLYSSRHFNVSFINLVAFLTFQFCAVKYLEMDASEENVVNLSGNVPTNLLTSSICQNMGKKDISFPQQLGKRKNEKWTFLRCSADIKGFSQPFEVHFAVLIASEVVFLEGRKIRYQPPILVDHTCLLLTSILHSEWSTLIEGSFH